MATLPYFGLGPTAIAAFVGLIHGPDKTETERKDDWRTAVVDVVIPAYNAESEIDLCIASIVKQTLQPRRILIIDDGSVDHTQQFAQEIGERFGLTNIVVEKREKNIGKTPSVQEGAYESDADVEFILDSDTILLSDNYIERAVEELYESKGIASSCGTILPLTEKERHNLLNDPKVGPQLQAHYKKHHEAGYYVANNVIKRFSRFVTNMYRDVLYKYVQRFAYHGEMVFFGSIIHPVGCAVAYRRKYIKYIFDNAKEILGSDLTTSEDIYIGFAFDNEGYRNIQLQDVKALTLEPPIYRLPFQRFLWSSAFLQSCYYFSSLVSSPFKALKRYYHKRKATQVEKETKRRSKQSYRQPFGAQYTEEYGRPIGWFILTNLIEKIAFPLVLILFLVFGYWEAFILTFIVETLISTIILTVVSKGERIKMFFKSLFVSPIRYISLIYDFFVSIWFLVDISIRGKKTWRK